MCGFTSAPSVPISAHSNISQFLLLKVARHNEVLSRETVSTKHRASSARATGAWCLGMVWLAARRPPPIGLDGLGGLREAAGALENVCTDRRLLHTVVVPVAKRCTRPFCPRRDTLHTFRVPVILALHTVFC